MHSNLPAKFKAALLQDKRRKEREEEDRQNQVSARRSMGEGAPMDGDMPASPHSRNLRAPGSSPPPAYIPSPSGHPMQNGEMAVYVQPMQSSFYGTI